MGAGTSVCGSIGLGDYNDGTDRRLIQGVADPPLAFPHDSLRFYVAVDTDKVESLCLRGLRVGDPAQQDGFGDEGPRMRRGSPPMRTS